MKDLKKKLNKTKTDYKNVCDDLSTKDKTIKDLNGEVEHLTRHRNGIQKQNVELRNEIISLKVSFLCDSILYYA